ncbi:MAG: hypothetical protein ABI158_03095 [Edaphobacter sp.]
MFQKQTTAKADTGVLRFAQNDNETKKGGAKFFNGFSVNLRIIESAFEGAPEKAPCS